MSADCVKGPTKFVRPKQYLAFRVGNDASGKYRYWTQKDEGYGTFEHGDLAKVIALRDACRVLDIPVYYFGLFDDTLEESQLLSPGDPTPETY